MDAEQNRLSQAQRPRRRPVPSQTHSAPVPTPAPVSQSYSDPLPIQTPQDVPAWQSVPALSQTIPNSQPAPSLDPYREPYRAPSPYAQPAVSPSQSAAYSQPGPRHIPYSQPLPALQSASGSQYSIRTSQDEAFAYDLLNRNKGEKIESRSRLSRAFMTKSKLTKFTDVEIFEALLSVVNGRERAGPGVVEVLRDLFIAEGGDVNFVPQKKSLFSKNEQARSELLERAARDGDNEVVNILSKYSDGTSLGNALLIALRNRDAPTASRGAVREEQMIQTLISKGADGSNIICPAVARGDEPLLRMLLSGQPSQRTPGALAEALPIAVAFRDPAVRQRLIGMVLQKRANPNFRGGEAMYQATKQYDMVSLDTLLECHPHPASLSRAFAVALNLPDSSRRFEACQKLINAGATGQEVDKGLMIAITTEQRNIEFLKLILRTALVDYEGGSAVCLAVTNEQEAHLRLMLEKRPNGITYDGAIAAAMRLRNPRDQLKYCRILVGAGPPIECCSKALVVAVKSQKEEMCRIFLEKGASPDYEGGASIAAAALAENVGILELLVEGEFEKPNNASLVAGFGVVLSVSTAPQKKTKLLRLILDAGLKGPALDVALINSSKPGPDSVAMCKLFLEYGASINAQGGEALDISTRTGNIELLELLLKGPHPPAPEILSRIFQSSQRLDPKLRPQATKLILEANMPINGQVAAALDGLVLEKRHDMETIGVLLSHNTSVHHENHRPLLTAATAFNKSLLSLLLAHSTDSKAASAVFEAVMKIESFWAKPEAFAILTILLENGAEGVSVNEALIKAVADGQPSARHFEVTLLEHRADIDYKAGEALQIATERGEPALVKRMLALNPNSESVSMALPFAFFSKLGEDGTSAIIEAFVEISAAQLDPDFMHPEIPEPPVFLCLNHFPDSLKILELTLKAGYHVDQKMSSDNGRYTALFWAISAKGGKIGDPVVELLISRGAELNHHPEPLLHLAIENSRTKIVQCLIDAGVDVDLTNDDGISPLSLATQKNDIATMQALLKASAAPNDGSLHDAARMTNSDAIELLIKHGHDVNFPLVRLNGRPPLFELCLYATTHLSQSQATAPQKEKQLKKALQTLISAGALTDLQMPQVGNRALIHFCLDCANPHMMTKCFLETGQFKDINKDYNLFSDGEYTYSPTRYVEKGCCVSNKTQSQSIVALLKSFHALDRYWKNEGPQPIDMINAPTHIKENETERLAREKIKFEESEALRRRIEAQQLEIETQRRKIALAQEAAQVEQERADRNFRQKQAQAAAAHAAYIQKENDRLRVQETRDRHVLKQAASMTQMRDAERELEYRRNMRLMEEQKRLASSELALGWAWESGAQSAGRVGAGGNPNLTMRALGMNKSKSNMDLGKQRQIEGARIEEVD